MEVFDFVNFGALASGQTSILLQQMLSQVSVVLVASRAGNEHSRSFTITTVFISMSITKQNITNPAPYML